MADFDAHTHAFAPSQVAARQAIADRDRAFREIYADPTAAIATAPAVIEALTTDGFEGALLAGFAFAHGRDLAEQSEHILEAIAKHPTFFAAVPANPGLSGWEQSLVAARDLGAVAIGELRPHAQGWDPLGPDARRLCALASELGMALLWHVSEPVGHPYPGKHGGISPSELIHLSCAFPSLPMIGAHLGGGAAFYLQMPELRSTATSLYFDTAAAFLLYDDDCVRRLVDLAGPSRVMFASDYPLLSPRRQLERVRASLPGDIAEAVSGANAYSLFSELRNS
ncbi:MAG: amidohydrolase family protein [Dehalococcoidia bacterium]